MNTHLHPFSSTRPASSHWFRKPRPFHRVCLSAVLCAVLTVFFALSSARAQETQKPAPQQEGSQSKQAQEKNPPAPAPAPPPPKPAKPPNRIMTPFGEMDAPVLPRARAAQADDQKSTSDSQTPKKESEPTENASKPQKPPEQKPETPQPAPQNPKTESQPEGQQPANPSENPPAATPGGNQEMSVALNLENADLYQVLRIIGSELKINYLVDPSVKGTVSINTSGPISRSDLFSLLQTILQLNGAAIVKEGSYYRVISAGDAKAQPVPLEFAKAPEAPPAPGETLVLEVFPMRFVSAAEIAKVLAPFISPAGQVVVSEKGNILLVLETVAKLKQVHDMLNVFDNSTFSRQRVRLFPVVNNSAKTIISELQDIFSGYSLTGSSAIRFVPVESLNAVLAICPAPEAFAEIQAWIHQLDQPPQEVGEQNFVYPVQNAKASDLRDILIELYGGSVPRLQPAPVSATPSNPMFPGATVEEAKKTQPAPSPERVQGRIHVLSDEKNNALIIQATPHDYEIVKRTLVQLDILPRQVLIDAKIYEVNLTGNLSLGISYFLDQQNKVPGPLTTSGSFSAGQTGGSLKATTFSIIGQTRALQMFLSATDQRSRIRVLSAPSILVTDNTSARIQVGASVPVPIGSALTPVESGGTSVFAQTIQYQDTGVILTVTPHINASGVVTLNLSQEVSSAIANTTSQIVAPVINKSSFQTSVVLADGEPLALGGIITTSNSLSKDRIPVLGEIPVVGALFGTTSRQTSRTELVLILTPHVQQNLPQAAEQSQAFIEKMRELKKNMEKMN